jgi:hypothetical protein
MMNPRKSNERLRIGKNYLLSIIFFTIEGIPREMPREIHESFSGKTAAGIILTPKIKLNSFHKSS